MPNKVKQKYVYNLIQKTFVQVIGQLRWAFSCGLPEIISVWKFYGRRRLFKVDITCKYMLDKYTSLDSEQGVLVTRLLSWIEVCSIAAYINCLKSVSAFLYFVQRYIPLYNITSICFVLACNNLTLSFLLFLLFQIRLPDPKCPHPVFFVFGLVNCLGHFPIIIPLVSR